MEPTSSIKLDDGAKSRLVSANTRFGFKLYTEIFRQDFGQNIFISPFSLASTLAMALNGASGKTLRAVAIALELQTMMSLDEVNDTYALLKAILERSGSGFQMVIANSLWAHKELTYKPEFMQRTQHFYEAKIGQLDFADPAAAAKINAWITKKTNRKITRIVEDISPATLILLIDAVYFKGIWNIDNQFDEEKTREGVFTLLNGRQKRHPMMSLPQARTLRYYRDQNFEAVSLPYAETTASMYIFLPSGQSSLAEFHKHLTAENWEIWMTRFKKGEGDIILPRFRFEYAKTLTEILKTLGMAVAFDRDRANFGNIGSDISNISIDTIQKDKILILLRELYKQDVEHRDLIAAHANNFKKRNTLSPKEFRFFVQRLNECGISFERRLFQAALAEPLLTVELVPHTCWFSNVRDHVNKKTWDKLRQSTYQKAGYVCEICGGCGPKWPVECHEIWHYDDKRHIQTLAGLTALCPSCHAVKHIGLSGLRGKGEAAEAHLAKVNGWTKQETAVYLEKVWHTWQVRSRYEWSLDLNWLKKQGIKVAAKR